MSYFDLRVVSYFDLRLRSGPQSALAAQGWADTANARTGLGGVLRRGSQFASHQAAPIVGPSMLRWLGSSRGGSPTNACSRKASTPEGCRGPVAHLGIRQVSDNPAFASVSPIRKPARICP